MIARLQPERRCPPAAAEGEDGFMLIAVIVMVFLVLLVLSIAAPRVAMQLQRERDVEAKHRGEQYVVAIRKFYGTFGRYPGSMKELENTNNQRFLRQEYVDPLTGKSDWRLIHLGQNKTTVKGLFGQDLPGLSGGLGAAAGLQSEPNSSPTGFGGAGSGPSGLGSGSAGGTGTTGGSGPGGGSAFQNNPGLGSNPGSGSGSGSGLGSGPGAGSATGAPGTSAAAGTGGGFGSGSNDSGLGGLNTTGGLIMGIGTPQKGDSIASVNGESTYQKWEFLYDPRIEQLRAGWSVFGGGGGGSVPAGNLGSGSTGAGPGGVPGSSPGSGFGSGFGSGAGSGQAPGTNAPGATGPGATGPGSTGPGSTGPSPQNPSDPNQPGSGSGAQPPASPSPPQ